jgi:hypothetical protein
MRTHTLLTLTAVSLAASVPANAMMKDGMHPAAMAHMSAADTRRMQRCNAMSHSRMMHNPACARMMRMHPDMMHHDMMHHDPMMKHEGAMKHPDAMSHDSMMKSGH